MNYPDDMRQYDNMLQSPYYDTSHDDYMDNRCGLIERELRKRGRTDSDWIARVADRFVEIELKEKLAWGPL